MRPNQENATVKPFDMRSQDDAVVREFKEALEDGHMELVWRIYRANPDLRPRFEELLGPNDL